MYGDASRLVIPTPEAKLEPNINYGDVYVNNVKVPKALIHMQSACVCVCVCMCVCVHVCVCDIYLFVCLSFGLLIHFRF